MTSVERILAVIDGVRYLTRYKIPGAIVECGVWRGGSSMAATLTLLEVGDSSRDLYLYDTFEGMTTPTDVDLRYDGGSAAEQFALVTQSGRAWARAGLDEVQRNMTSTGYPSERLSYIRGPVEETIPETVPEIIALLRLDTDWYESTKHELEHLYPRLAPGGILIVDDYGHWRGSQTAVDEYFARSPQAVFFHRLDYTGRIAIKT